MASITGKGNELTVLLISPDRTLASALLESLEQSRVFQVLSDLKSYPPVQTLEIRLRQLQPDVLMLDLVTNLETACEILQQTAQISPGTQVIGLHQNNDSEALLRTLRLGATDFLYEPFEMHAQVEAADRIRRMKEPDQGSDRELGRVVAFASTKPGSGSSTLATQTAFMLKRKTGKRVLLADLDVMGGTIGFYLKLNHAYSVVDALEHSSRLNAAVWTSLVAHCGGVDILPAPEMPYASDLPSDRMHDVLQYARMIYDWVILDLPAVFYRTSLMMLTEADATYLVSTSELPSLHLARKAINMLSQLGLTKDRYKLVVNRVNKRDGIGLNDLEKIFNSPVEAMFPNDYFSLHRVVTLGQPLGSDCELGKAIEMLSAKVSGAAEAEKKRSAGMQDAPKPALSQT